MGFALLFALMVNSFPGILWLGEGLLTPLWHTLRQCEVIRFRLPQLNDVKELCLVIWLYRFLTVMNRRLYFVSCSCELDAAFKMQFIILWTCWRGLFTIEYTRNWAFIEICALKHIFCIKGIRSVFSKKKLNLLLIRWFIQIIRDKT